MHPLSSSPTGNASKPTLDTVSDLSAFRRPDSYARRFAPERAALLPGQSDLYQAAGYAESELSRLVLVMGKDGFSIGGTAYLFLQYMYIGTVELGFTDEGQMFRFVLSDTQPKQVTVYGDNLVHICDQMSLRRLHWIRQADADYRAPESGDEPVITRIEICDGRTEEH
jgi:hypothetical protein